MQDDNSFLESVLEEFSDNAPDGETHPTGPVIPGAVTPMPETVNDYKMHAYGTLDLYGQDVTEEKGRIAFIKKLVSLCRMSPEYARYRNFLIENVDQNTCAILTGLSADEASSAGLELHHHPLTLFDIVETVLNRLEASGGRVTSFAVANAVMSAHWAGKVGIVPLTATIHEAAHAGQIDIDPRSIFGDWMSFVRENRDVMSDAVREKLLNLGETWAAGTILERNRSALELNVVQWTAEPITIAELQTPRLENHQ